jgi:hypothetical protein
MVSLLEHAPTNVIQPKDSMSNVNTSNKPSLNNPQTRQIVVLQNENRQLSKELKDLQMQHSRLFESYKLLRTGLDSWAAYFSGVGFVAPTLPSHGTRL